MLLPYQQKLLQDKSAMRVVEKSRRVGVSWVSACEAVLTATKTSNAGGMDVWYMGYNQRMAEEFIQDCSFWLKIFEHLLKRNEFSTPIRYQALQWQLKLGNFRITALSSKPENFRGKQGLAIVDEAAFHPDLDKLLQSVMALLIWGGRVLVISTHHGRHNPFFELVEQAKVGKYSLHSLPLNQALEQGLYQKICHMTNQPWNIQKQQRWVKELYDLYDVNAQEELNCIPKDSESQYFAEALVRKQMQDGTVLRFVCPSGFEQLPAAERKRCFNQFFNDQVLPNLQCCFEYAETIIGLDFGRSGHQTAIAVVCKKEEQCFLKVLIELQNAPFVEQEEFLGQLIEAVPNFQLAALDARGNGQYLAEKIAQRFGFSIIHQVFLTKNYYIENLPKLRLALEQQRLWLPKDNLLKQDFCAFSWQAGRFCIAQVGKRHGDSVIALLLALVAGLHPKPVYAYETVASHHSF